MFLRMLFMIIILYFLFSVRVCPIFQISNVTGDNLDLLKMFLNLLSIRAHFKKDEPAEFQIDDTYSVPVGENFVVKNILCTKLLSEGKWFTHRRFELLCFLSMFSL